MSFSPVLDALIEALRCLPGVGPKSAQRMSFHLLERRREQAKQLAQCIEHAMEVIKHCERCNTFSENTLCRICSNPKREISLLCIVESPADLLAIEQTSAYRGLYFVLMGHLSPLDGIGPEELGLEKLKKHIIDMPPQEVILATNPTVEGEATAHYISEMIKPYKVKTTRIAHGVPMGGELEFVDGGTLARALTSRA